MRILCLSQDLGIPIDGPKGAAAHLRAISAGLAAAGHEVDILAPAEGRPEGVTRLKAPALYDGLGPGVPKKVGRALRHIWANPATERALERAIAKAKPDLIYERLAPFAAAGGIVARRHGIPHILEVNAPLAREGAAYRGQALGEAAAALETASHDNTGALLAVSSALRDELVAGGIAAERIHVVPNGFDPQRFRARPLGPEGPLTFGFVGGLRPWHGIADMAAAFRTVAGCTDARLTVIGTGPEAGHLEALASDLPGRVDMLGHVAHDDVPARLAEVDVALAPYPALDSFYFSPLKVLEYMGAGRAIIASRIGQLDELLEDGKTALLVPAGDAEALARAMLRLHDDPDLRIRLGRQAAEEAHARHSWAERVDRILAIAQGLGAPV